MAIDSRDKRASALNFEEGFTAYTPDGVNTQADRQDSLHAYRGILATVPAVSDRFYDWWWVT